DIAPTLPIYRLADLPNCRFAENYGSAGASPSSEKKKISVLEGEHPCEPKEIGRVGARPSSETKKLPFWMMNLWRANLW
ncbi:hypothetical protein, partial [Escherichia coli]|uniref:hypothetical protein n=1 Tax=Escherichia coli TaxID=562 RepID=UPI00195F6AD4